MKRAIKRGWRAIFARSDIPSDAPFGLDDGRLVWIAFSLAVPWIPVLVVYVVLGPLARGNEFWAFVNTGLIVVLGGGTLIAAFWLTVSRSESRYRALRESIAAPAREAGWTYAFALPLPSPQTMEMVFRNANNRIVAHGLTETVLGEFRDRPFSAGHLSGHVVSTKMNASKSASHSENIVVMQLPALLPEFKLFDLSTSRSRDYGVRLPVSPTPYEPLNARWEIQSHYPDFVGDMLGEEMLAFLVEFPPIPCTISCRNGYLIASRDPLATFESVSERLRILADFIDLLPAIVWRRETSPHVAGVVLHGYKRPMITGPEILRR